MFKIWTIAVREYLATVKTRAFVIGVVMMPVLMGASIAASVLYRKSQNKTEKVFGVVDRTSDGRVFKLLEPAIERYNREEGVDDETGERTSPIFKIERIEPSAYAPEAVDAQRLALSERVRRGEISGFMEVGPEAMVAKDWLSAVASSAFKAPEKTTKEDSARDPKAIRFQANPTKTGVTEFYRMTVMVLQVAMTAGPKAADQIAWKKLLDVKPPIMLLGLSTKASDGALVDDTGATKSIVNLLVAFACVALMYAMIMMSGMPLMQSVLEEKMQKIAEVLLGSATPFQIMSGKLLGGVGTALTLSLLYLGGGVWALFYFGYADQVPPGLVPWFVFYLVLALVMFGSVFLAIGAACTDMKEPQALVTPVILVLVAPMMMLGPLLSEPDATAARVASFFPPVTPMLMIARQALSATIQWWEPVLGATLVVAFTLFCVWAAGRIFRVGLLLQGKGAKFGEMVSWVFRSA